MRVVLLAGGKSKRMGRNKLFLPIQIKPLIQFMVDRLLQSGFLVSIITNTSNLEIIKNVLPQSIQARVSIFEDVFPEKGPIGGIYSGLFYTSEDYVFALAADLPFFKPELLQMMEKESKGYDVVVPKTEKGLEPLFAVYRKSCQSVFLTMIQENHLKISESYNLLTTKLITKEEVTKIDPFCESFMNINTQEDYEEIIRLE